MSSAARSLLLTTLLYFVALGAVAAGLYGSLSVVGPAVQAHFLKSGGRTPSRLDFLVADARAIHEALATPIEPVEPLPPITAQPLRPPEAARPEHEHKVSRRRLNAEARGSYAMAAHGGGATRMSPDRYRPQ